MSKIEIISIINQLRSLNIERNKEELTRIHKHLTKIEVKDFDLEKILENFQNEIEVKNFFILLLRAYVEISLLDIEDEEKHENSKDTNVDG